MYLNRARWGTELDGGGHWAVLSVTTLTLEEMSKLNGSITLTETMDTDILSKMLHTYSF